MTVATEVGCRFGAGDIPVQFKHALERVWTQRLDKPSPNIKAVPRSRIVEQGPVLARGRDVEIKVAPHVATELHRAILAHKPPVDHVVDVPRRDRVGTKSLNILEDHLELAGLGYKVVAIRFGPR